MVKLSSIAFIFTSFCKKNRIYPKCFPKCFRPKFCEFSECDYFTGLMVVSFCYR